MKFTLYTQADLLKEIKHLGGELKQIANIKEFLKETKPKGWRKRYLYLIQIEILNKIKLHYLFKIKSKNLDY